MLHGIAAFSIRLAAVNVDAPKKTTDKLQRVLNSATRIISNACKFYRRELHWLDVDNLVWFRVSVQVYKYLHNMVPGYLSTLYRPMSSVPGAVTYARLVVANWTSPVSIWPCTGDEPLPMPVMHSGTLCLTVSRTLLLLRRLNVSEEHDSFLPIVQSLSSCRDISMLLYFLNLVFCLSAKRKIVMPEKEKSTTHRIWAFVNCMYSVIFDTLLAKFPV